MFLLRRLAKKFEKKKEKKKIKVTSGASAYLSSIIESFDNKGTSVFHVSTDSHGLFRLYR